MSKKIVYLLICLCLALSLCACGNATDGGKTSSPASAPEKEEIADEKGSFIISDQKLEIGMNLTETVLNALGDPNDVQNAPSCHFDGEDTIYIYDDYSLYTYADGDKNVLYLIEISGSGVSTSEGISIGSSCEDVREIYGAPSEEAETYLIYEMPTSIIRFSHDGAAVNLIEYEEKE